MPQRETTLTFTLHWAAKVFWAIIAIVALLAAIIVALVFLAKNLAEGEINWLSIAVIGTVLATLAYLIFLRWK